MSPERRGTYSGKERRVFRVRGDDPPGWRFKLGIIVRRHPVLLAVMVALTVLALPVVGLAVQNGKLKAQADKLERQNVAIRATQRGQTANRRAVASAVCRALNSQAVSNNGQNRYLQGILVGSAKSSKAFEAIYRRLGLPPYERRLEVAQDQADGLARLAVRKIDCGRFSRDVNPDESKTLVIPYLEPEFPKLDPPPNLP